MPRWPGIAALLAVGGLLALVSPQLTFGPSWLPLAVIILLAIPLTVASVLERHTLGRPLAFVGLVTVTVAVAASAVLLVQQLVYGPPVKGSYLLTGGGAIWIANFLTFAL